MDDVVKIINTGIHVANNLFEKKAKKWVSKGARIANISSLSFDTPNGLFNLGV